MKSTLNIYWKDWCWSWSSNTLATWVKSWLIGKDPGAGKNWGQEEKGMKKDEMVGWLDGITDSMVMSLPKFKSTASVRPSNHLIFCHPLLLLPSIFPSVRVFSKESVLHIRSQSIRASASVLPMNIQDWFPLGVIGWISLQSKGLSRVLSKQSQSHWIILYYYQLI